MINHLRICLYAAWMWEYRQMNWLLKHYYHWNLLACGHLNDFHPNGIRYDSRFTFVAFYAFPGNLTSATLYYLSCRNVSWTESTDFSKRSRLTKGMMPIFRLVLTYYREIQEYDAFASQINVSTKWININVLLTKYKGWLPPTTCQPQGHKHFLWGSQELSGCENRAKWLQMNWLMKLLLVILLECACLWRSKWLLS